MGCPDRLEPVRAKVSSEALPLRERQRDSFGLDATGVLGGWRGSLPLKPGFRVSTHSGAGSTPSLGGMVMRTIQRPELASMT